MISRRAAQVLAQIRAKSPAVLPPIRRRTLDPLAVKLMGTAAEKSPQATAGVEGIIAQLQARLDFAEQENAKMHNLLADTIVKLRTRIQKLEGAAK